MQFSRRRLLAGLALCPICATVARADGVHWSYDGQEGPEAWGQLDKGFSACAVGDQQSPIDLSSSRATLDAPRPKIEWQPMQFKLVNNGHTIEAVPVKGKSVVLIDGKTYEMKQFHFHSPSEHALNGKREAMEAHFVHKADDGKLAVIAVLMTAGGDNSAFSSVMRRVPQQVGGESVEITLDPRGFVPSESKIFRYEGSLTTPPCSETVSWNVFDTPIEVEEEDIARFKALYPMNARPLQPLNQRALLQTR